jgi:hypothetical protein
VNVAHDDRVRAVVLSTDSVDPQGACAAAINPIAVPQIGAIEHPLVGQRFDAAGDDPERHRFSGEGRLGRWRSQDEGKARISIQ